MGKGLLKKDKGFTLVELLAIIVILAIIALITVPIITNIIKNVQESADARSVEAYAKALESKYYMALMTDTTTQLTNIKVTEADYSGSKVTCGVPTLDSNGKIVLTGCKVEGRETTFTYNNGVATKTTTEPEVSYKCKRATTLHTEECDSYCSEAGYTETGSKGTTTITYGSLGTTGTLKSGDAFDCDINGDGVYDATKERFYYVSDLYNTTTKEYDSNYAVLIYYNNTTSGIADNTEENIINYDESGENWHGPRTAIVNLPTEAQWSNIRLSNTNRAIITEISTNETNGGTLPTSYSYGGYAARFLTVQEINKACGITVGYSEIGELDSCNYLMEGTRYSNGSLGTRGYWLESPEAARLDTVWQIFVGNRNVYSFYASHSGYDCGTRPAIEILKSEILY